MRNSKQLKKYTFSLAIQYKNTAKVRVKNICLKNEIITKFLQSKSNTFEKRMATDRSSQLIYQNLEC